ncbi:MAG: hypothetical protein KatS3mg104_2669 [Phycisphaerae bacterium]|nr:MAG: hypothetical protein KatS3mg104_2669 [Phycisphaerae bacterium]
MANTAADKSVSVPLTPLIGSGSPEEVERRINVLLEMGTSRGYLTYEELNTKLPDEVVAPDRLDSLLMTIDEMGIKLIDDSDVSEFSIQTVSQRGRKDQRGQNPGDQTPHQSQSILDQVYPHAQTSCRDRSRNRCSR